MTAVEPVGASMRGAAITDAETPGFWAPIMDELYVLVVAGLSTGVAVVGVGSRVAMLVLRLTSPDRVRGVTSDDGFTIGRFTLAGSYNLLMIAAGVGVIGAATYQWVRPWLLGPNWFRRVTLAVGAGAVVGSMLVHPDGIDFTLLEPMWLAVTLFVALPAAFAVCVAAAVDRVEQLIGSRRVHTRRRWLIPLALVAFFPPVMIVLAVAIGVLLVWVPIRRRPALRRLVATRGFGVIIRAGWLAIAVLGLIGLLHDISELRIVGQLFGRSSIGAGGVPGPLFSTVTGSSPW